MLFIFLIGLCHDTATILDFRIDPSCCGWSYCRQLLPRIWQRSDSYRCVLLYCQRPLFEIVHVVGLGHFVDSGCLRFDGRVVHFVVCDIVDSTSAVVRAAVCHIIEKYRLRLERGVVRVVNVGYILSNITI